MGVFKTVKQGSTGKDVYVLQAFLNTLQYTGKDGKPIKIDGTAGANTIYAINQFQKTQQVYGYPCGNGDGEFGTKCWARLGV